MRTTGPACTNQAIMHAQKEMQGRDKKPVSRRGRLVKRSHDEMNNLTIRYATSRQSENHRIWKVPECLEKLLCICLYWGWRLSGVPPPPRVPPIKWHLTDLFHVADCVLLVRLPSGSPEASCLFQGLQSISNPASFNQLPAQGQGVASVSPDSDRNDL